MARIRTVKPEFFKHEDLYEAERETGFPLRVAFAGLWCVADREGRFKWKPRQIKLDVLPYDEIDFSRVLDALLTRGFIVKYANGTDVYGCIPTFLEHQVINNREAVSVLPSIDDDGSQKLSIDKGFDACGTRDQRVDVAPSTPLSPAQGEGKGREGKGREGKEGSPTAPQSPQQKKSDTPLQAACRETLRAYAEAFWDRYGTMPATNATVNSQIKQFVQRVGNEDAPKVAAFYVRHPGQFYVTGMHQFGYAVKDAEKLFAEWKTNRHVTHTQGRQSDRTGANANAADEAIRILESQGVGT